MTRRAYGGFWAVLLLVLAVGIFGRGRRSPEPKPAPAQPSSRVTGLRIPEPVKPPEVTSQLPIRPVRPKVTAAVEKPAPKSQLRLRVVGVYDGDTLTGLDDAKNQHKIRLDAIDAPEIGQPYGQAAKRALSGKVFGKDVLVTVKSQDKYGRTVGHVLIDGRDVNLEMLEEGMAWHYVKYDQNKRLSKAEEQARAARVGLWADPDAMPPWEWRKLDKDERARRRAASSSSVR